MQAITITTTDGGDVGIEIIEMPEREPQRYLDLRHRIGGDLDLVVLNHAAICYVHAEGAYVKPRNPAATLFVSTAVSEDGRVLQGDIHGDVVILGRLGSSEGPVPLRELNRLLALASLVTRG